MTIQSDNWGGGLYATGTELLDAGCDCSFNPDDTDSQTAADLAMLEASQILFLLSGRTIQGSITTTVRPTRTAWECGCSDWIRDRLDTSMVSVTRPSGWFCGSSRLDLQGPISSITQIKIDGVVLDPSNYTIVDNSWLLYLADPTDLGVRHWPINQRLDLPNNAVGTFQITYVHGIPIPEFAKAAALELGCAALERNLLQRKSVGDTTTSISRQGISRAITNRAQQVSMGATPESSPMVLRFISLVNPKREPFAALAWSPDVPELNRV